MVGYLKNINKLEKGGLSGKPIAKISNETIFKFYKILKDKTKIIGVGGVSNGQDAFEKITSGATLVQLYTGMVYKGPGLVKDMKKELISILKKENIKNISEAVGISTWPVVAVQLYNSRKIIWQKDAN